MSRDAIQVTGVWLYNEVNENYAHGPDRWVVSVEVNGVWRRCIVESADGPTSHVIEPSGIRKAPVDPRAIDA